MEILILEKYIGKAFHGFFLSKIAYWIILLIGIYGLTSCQKTDISKEIEIREVWIPMSDGIKLAADLYLPGDFSQDQAFPILLEYLPYRKDEHRKLRYPVFSYFVQRGYVVARVDVRGTGRSEGDLIPYEYSEQEKQDGEEVIQWLSEQSYSTGNIGMFGISWGGFNAIQLAMRKPPALKAILAMMATDDLYQDDVHFIDGMMHVDAYEIGRDLKNVIPGAPDYDIGGNYFAEKFDTEPWLLKYKRQQRDGPFWDAGSLNSNYGSLTIPIFMISGWYDGYRDSTPRIFKNIKAPKKAIVGPWNHTFPHTATPPPSTEWREEAVRWFDYWLIGKDNGIMEEPPISVFIREGHGPNVPDSIGGEWRGYDGWPPSDQMKKEYYLKTNNELDTIPGSKGALSIEYRPSSGIEAGGSVMWWGDWSPDQKKTDQHSLIFETEPLEEEVTILGFPHLHFHASISAPQAHFLARLSDVSPDDSITIITGAGLNGSHRHSAVAPEAMIPGQNYPLDIEMHFTSWTFQKGHKIRLSMSNGQWPMIWPNPSLLTMNLLTGGDDPSSLKLPVISNQNHLPTTAYINPKPDPQLPGYKTNQFGTVSGFAEVSNTHYDPETGITKLTATNSGEVAYPWAKWTTSESITYHIDDLHPADASISSIYTIQIETSNKKLRWEGWLEFFSDKNNFYYDYTRKLFQESEEIRSKNWRDTIPRDFQ